MNMLGANMGNYFKELYDDTGASEGEDYPDISELLTGMN